jgi:hypothetical protein
MVDTLRAVALAKPARESVNLVMGVTISTVETINFASNASNLATEAADTAGVEATQATDVQDLARDPSSKFSFTFAKAGGIEKIIRGLKNTEAMGIYHICGAYLFPRLVKLSDVWCVYSLLLLVRLLLNNCGQFSCFYAEWPTKTKRLFDLLGSDLSRVCTCLWGNRKALY